MFIFDELDKIETPAETEGSAASPVTALLRALKSLFTTSGFYFVFIGGRDLHDQLVIETAQGDSVFESVFSYDQYIPCLWSETRQICERLVDSGPFERHRCAQCKSNYKSGAVVCAECGKYLRDPQVARQAFEQYVKYQTYRGRGIPRLLLRSIHSSITFINDRPFLLVTARERRRQRAFAQLWDRLLASEETSEYAIELGIQNTELDRRRLAMLYFVDWVLSNYDRPFTPSQAAAAVKSMSVKIRRDSEPIVMLATSVKIGLVEKLPDDQNAVRAEGAETHYRVLSRWLLDIGADSIHAMASSADSGDEFWLKELVGVGGMSQVHLAVERRTGHQVALKLLTSQEEKATERFAQEARLLRACCHPNVVRFISAGRLEGKPFLAMEFLDGVELRVILDAVKKLTTDVVIFIGQQASAGLAYLHEQKIFRNDVKPSNLVATSAGSVVVIDLGISKRDGDFDQFITRDGDLVGTPAYRAPEQFDGTPADARSDVYSFGAIIHEAVTGVPVMPKVRSSAEAAAKLGNLRIPGLNSGNPQLDQIVDRCLAADPSRRFQDMVAVAERLATLKGSGSSELRDLVSAVRKQASSAKRRSNQVTEMGTAVFSHGRQATHVTLFFQGNPIEPASNVSRLGAGEFTVILSGSVAVSSVTVMQGPDLKGETLALRRPRTRIGRRLDSDIQLFSSRVSRNHAEVILGIEQAWIEDSGSATGTYVDNIRLEPGVQVELRIGSMVRIGPYLLKFHSAKS
jgi:serine/threonine-protein kinase